MIYTCVSLLRTPKKPVKWGWGGKGLTNRVILDVITPSAGGGSVGSAP